MSREPDYVDPKTGHEYRVGGCLLSKEPSTLPLFGAPPNFVKNLPRSVDLRSRMTPVEHQGSTNSCVPNALAGALEYVIKSNKGLNLDISRLFMYYNGRLRSGFSKYNISDTGCNIGATVNTLLQDGCCKEAMFPFNTSNLNKRPPKHCYDTAKKHRVTSANAVPINLKSMKACLAEGYPFTFGINTYGSFNKAANNGGRVPMPNKHVEMMNAQHGAHALLAVGYSDHSRCFIVRNSWGPNWGDRGYCYLPYRYLANPEFTNDVHVIKGIASVHPRHPVPHLFGAQGPMWFHYQQNYYIPQDDPRLYSANSFFWMPQDNFNYMGALWRDGRLQADESSPLVLWIDEQTDEHSELESELKDTFDVRFEYRETFSDGVKYLTENSSTLQSSHFQIICHGYYRDQNKNPVDLLYLLNYLSLLKVSVFVLTSGKAGLGKWLAASAKQYGFSDWEQRLYITEKSMELLDAMRNDLKSRSA